MLGSYKLLLILAAALFTPFFFLPRALAADTDCQTLFNTRFKLFSVPSHSYTVQALPGGRSETSESIFANGAIYVLVRGKWIHSKITPQDMLKQEEENIRNSKSTCRHVRDEMVKVAALYMGHSENDGGKADAQTWISKSRGLPLKTEEDIDAGDGERQHMSIRYEYNNVRPPVGVQ